ncbi:MAG: CAP domain-containing protein, partial [Eubacteriales bacterium]
TISPAYCDSGTLSGVVEGGIVGLTEDEQILEEYNLTEEELEKAREEQKAIIKEQEVLNAAEKVEANPTTQKVTVDGEEVNFRAYNIKGHNYFMLRDIAHIFKGTEAQFEVGWDGEKFAISLELGKEYTGEGVGFNITKPHIKETGLKSKATIYKDGKEIKLLGYTIHGNTYFKLRDIGEEFNIGVSWDSINKVVVMKSDGTVLDTELAKEEQEVEEKEELEEPEEFDPFNTDHIKIDWDNVKPTTEEKKQLMREIMLDLINEAREERGLVKLELDDTLTEVAELKSADMKETGVYSHNGTYGTPRELISLFGDYSKNYTGENIDRGAMSAEKMFERWWESKAHRENMMRPKFRKIGIGFADWEYKIRGGFEKPIGTENIIEYHEGLKTYFFEDWTLYGTQIFTD